MNIDYTKIETAAAERKKNLAFLTELVNTAPRVLQMANEIQEYLNDLESTYRVIDIEGSSLLPQEVREVLSNLSMLQKQFRIVLGTYNQNDLDHGLLQLAQQAEGGVL